MKVRKIISVLLAVLMLCGAMPLMAGAASDAPWIDCWISDGYLANSVDTNGYYTNLKLNTRYYFCYQLYDKETGDLWDEVVSSSYTVTMTLRDPSGNVIKTVPYYIDRMCTFVSFDQVGTYTWTIEITGDYTYSNVIPFVIGDGAMEQPQLYIRTWFSLSALGADYTADSLTVGTTYYYCYELFDNVTGTLWDDIEDANYTVTLSVLNSNNEVVQTGTFDNDQSYIAIKLETVGTYTISVAIGGDYTYSDSGTVAVTEASSRGDVSGNGKIDARDYMMLKRYVLGSFTFTDEQLVKADVTGDGKVNARDYMMVKSHVLGTYTIR